MYNKETYFKKNFVCPLECAQKAKSEENFEVEKGTP